MALNNINKFRQDQTFQSGEFALHQIFQLKKNQTNIKKISTEKNLSIISIKSCEIESFRYKKKINDNDSNHIISEEEEKNLRKALSNHFVFRDITPEVLDLVVQEVIFCTFNKGDIIYKEGEEGNFFYVISKGKIEAFDKKNNIKTNYSEWDCFGELSLITQQKREETVKCLNDVELFSIDGIAFRETQKRINEKLLKDKFDFLNNISIFETLDSISKYNIAQKIILKIFEQNTKIISNEEEIDENLYSLYIIKEGSVSCKIGDKEIRKLKVNDCFGQNSLLTNTKSSMDFIAIEKTFCYQITKEELIEALGNTFLQSILFYFFKNCIDKSQSLKVLFPENLLNDLFNLFTLENYLSNSKILEKNSNNIIKGNSKRLIFIVDGSVYKNNKIFAIKGEVIGIEFFKDYNNDSLLEDLTVFPDLITLEADILSLSHKLKIDLKGEKPLNLLTRLNKLKNINIFKNLSENILGPIAEKLIKKEYCEGEKIIEEGEIGDLFYLIIKGRVKITKNGIFIRELENGNYFGENSLFELNAKRSATVIAIEKKVTCYVLSKKEFDFLLTDNNIKNYLLKQYALQDTSIKLTDLNYIKFLGKGKFGSVSLVHNNKNIYAIKAISRKNVEKQKNLAKYFVSERRIMLQLDHPFIIKMVKSMKNNLFCFLLIEYINGKSLRDYLNNRKSINNIYETQFYIGTLLIILEYLQKKKIAHRDIKPQNLMIDSNGYLKMIDFGTAKLLTNYTNTIVGTPHFIAPEILQGKGYSLSCDFWSVGICMFEIFYDEFPFGNDAHEVIEIYKDVLHKDFNFPNNDIKFKYVNQFIENLLTKKVNKRICNIRNLKQMHFFKGFDFHKLNDFNYDPPFKPETNDTSKYLDINSSYENIVNHETIFNSSTIKKGKKEHIPHDYDKNWADEF